MRLIILLLISSALFSNGVDVKKIAKKIGLLKNHIRISKEIDYKVYDPFAKAKPILLKKITKDTKVVKRKRKRPIIIQTILNKKAFINNRWFGVGDRVFGYLIKSIKRDAIFILKNHKWVKISMKKRKNIVTVKEIIK